MPEWKFTPERRKYHKIAQKAAWSVNSKMRSGKTPTQFANRPEYLNIRLRELNRKRKTINKQYQEGDITSDERDSKLNIVKTGERQLRDRLNQMKKGIVKKEKSKNKPVIWRAS